MANEPEDRWRPDWAEPPGETLLEALQERSMTQVDLARRTNRPVKTINEIVKGKSAITADTAIQFERVLGISAAFWNALETQYRSQLAAQRSQVELEEQAEWLTEFPLNDLVRFGVIPKSSQKAQMVGALLHFFGVGNSSAWNNEWSEPIAAFRESPAFEQSPKAIASWLRWGELMANDITTSDFSLSDFEKEVKAIKTLSRKQPFDRVLLEIQGRLANVGVAFVWLPELKGTHVSGAARWLSGNRPLIQVSLRHKTDDEFWFTLFHEFGHIANGVRSEYFVDEPEPERRSTSPEEVSANQFANTVLFASDAYESLVDGGTLTVTSIRNAAKEEGVSAGIFVGRLQREAKAGRSHFHDLKKPIRFS